MVATLLVLAALQRLDVWALLLTTTLGGIVWAGAQPACPEFVRACSTASVCD
jgi:hypothetical protein